MVTTQVLTSDVLSFSVSHQSHIQENLVWSATDPYAVVIGEATVRYDYDERSRLYGLYKSRTEFYFYTVQPRG